MRDIRSLVHTAGSTSPAAKGPNSEYAKTTVLGLSGDSYDPPLC